jgi:uncharacterized protein (DUF433 family)
MKRDDKKVKFSMIALPETLPLPLKLDENGIIRVSNTRVSLDTLIAFYHQGESPEALHEGFPTIPLADIYAVIAYYLAHETEMNIYLKQNEEEAKLIRHEWESDNPPPTKAELLERLAKKRSE